MEESPGRRRLSTPSRREAHAATRSRSRLRPPSSRRLLPDSELRRERLLLLERELQLERDRLRASEERHASRANDERRSRSRQRRSSSRDSRRSRATDRGAGRRVGAGYRERSRSPSFSKRDLIDIFKQMRDGLTLPPVPQGAQQPLQKIDHKNILPDFDPSTKNQRIDIWLKKVNECASVYGWDERTTTHFAMQKLQGLAKTWYQSLNTILFTWPEWQEKLISAFPCEQNYGQTLEDMIKRKSKFNEPIEVYYYEKLSLINQCEIEGRRAVDCIIHGLSDRGLRLGALALRCSQPDQLLQYLLSNKDPNQISGGDRLPLRNKNFSNTNVNNARSEGKPTPPIGCYNCREKGHSFLYCPKPLVRCTQCNKVGHTAEKCYSKTGDKPNKTTVAIGKTMRIDYVDKDVVSNRDSKFIKDVQLNDVSFRAFIDFGSDVTLVRESAARELGVPHDNVLSFMKGFGNDIVQSLGGLTVNVSVDGVNATVLCKVVSDHLLEMPVLIGQSFTEQPHISVYKDVNQLQFFNVGNELPSPAVSDDSEKLLSFSPAGTVEIFGPASVRIETKSLFDGNVLIKNCVAGKPGGQYFIAGGLHRSVNGRVNVLVVPCANSCLITSKLVFCRAERVDVVNRLIVDTPIEMRTDSTLDENQVKICETASEDAKQTLLVMLEKYQHCFASSLKDIGCTNAAEMNIELNSQRPIVYRPYRLSHHEREKVRSMVADMLDAVKERYPMPIIEDEIARLAGQGCFITLDLTSGYYQVPISEQSKHLTSFVTPDGQYEFNRMPFGLANAPAVFQRMINTILGSARFSKATAYIDDILIFGKDSTECLERLEEVLQIKQSKSIGSSLEQRVSAKRLLFLTTLTGSIIGLDLVTMGHLEVPF
ncbi:uncharacterized protein [Choristoneura fumiferana]|uniref:uncharacterized protein n=1 Tax=Choristoneura fumiferana TaxID=7141 RepID=UPI003D154C58